MTDSDYIQAMWERTHETLRAAESLVAIDPNSAASRAYYAAFHAVSALFGLEGRSFRKHRDVLASVHRDLVHAGRWPNQLGQDFSSLQNQRRIGDYGATGRVTQQEAVECVEAAKRIIAAVRNESPDTFADPSTD